MLKDILNILEIPSVWEKSFPSDVVVQAKLSVPDLVIYDAVGRVVVVCEVCMHLLFLLYFIQSTII